MQMIETAQRLLRDLGMDSERSNERSAYVLLALAKLSNNSPWSTATNGMYTTRELMDWIRDELGQDYAANTRETIRRFTLHQFIAGGLVEYNADDPNRATNSPKNNYRLTPLVLRTIVSIGTPEYAQAVAAFRAEVNSWMEQKAERRGMNKIPVRLPSGDIVNLSAGGQNVLIKAMVEELCPRYTPNGEVIYIDDTDKQQNRHDHPVLERFGIEIPDHGKAPDLIVWMPDKSWLFLMEACSTHGPIDVIRKRDLARLFRGAEGHIVYVSCFPNRAIMRKYLAELAWETEAWCADDPDHMIHLDGERFLGPYND